MNPGAETLAYEADTQRRPALDAPPSRKPPRGAKAPVPPAKPTIKSAMSRATALRREVDGFQQAWPPCPGGARDPFPGFTWTQLERQLSDLALPARAPIAAGLIQSVRTSARHKPPEMVLREILCLASALMDEEGEVSDDRR